jgi:hypothetical protein
MLTKLLFTLALAVGVILLAGRGAAAGAPARHPLARNARRWIRPALGVVVAMMVVAAGGMVYQLFWEERELLRVRVIASASGSVREYLARRGEIGQRSFVTPDGVQVRLAEGDRMELMPLEPVANSR